MKITSRDALAGEMARNSIVSFPGPNYDIPYAHVCLEGLILLTLKYWDRLGYELVIKCTYNYGVQLPIHALSSAG